MNEREFFASRGAHALIGATILLVTALLMHAAFKVDCDDAYIHLRIAENWAKGNGPVFNVGERVEASTSPMWLGLLTIAIHAGLPGWPVAWAIALLAAAACGAGVGLLARDLVGPRAGYVAPLLTATQLPFAVWSAMPMEHGLAACFIVWTIWLLLAASTLPRAAGVGFLAALTALTRPEALLLVPLFIVAPAWWVPADRRTRAALIACVAAVLPLVIVFLCRYSYYGSLLPNTYVAKVQGMPLLQRFRTGAAYVGQFLLFELLLVALAAWALRKAAPKLRVLAVVVSVFLLGIATTGGDWFPYARLIVPVIPLLCVLAAAGIEYGRRHSLVFVSAVVAVQMLLSVRPKQHQFSRIALLHAFVENCDVIGKSFFRLPHGTVAMESIGIIGYRDLERPILDLVGLADAHIARSPHLPGVLPGHDHSDVNYVLSRAREMVMPYSWPRAHTISDAEELAYLAKDRDSWAAGEALVRDDRFRRTYEPFDFVLDDGNHLRLWWRRDFIAH